MEDFGHAFSRFIHRAGLWILAVAVVILIVIIVVLKVQSDKEAKLKAGAQTIYLAEKTGDIEALRKALGDMEAEKKSLVWLWGSHKLGWHYLNDPKQDKLEHARAIFKAILVDAPEDHILRDLARRGLATRLIKIADNGDGTRDQSIINEAMIILDEVKIGGQLFMKDLATLDQDRQERITKALEQIRKQLALPPEEPQTDPKPEIPETDNDKKPEIEIPKIYTD